jgi:hypothetical protein
MRMLIEPFDQAVYTRVLRKGCSAIEKEKKKKKGTEWSEARGYKFLY